MTSDPDAHIALGIELQLIPTEQGGRATPIGPLRRDGPQYRPNWGFEALGDPPAQTGAPVVSWEKSLVNPGDRMRAVIVAMYPEYWGTVSAGAALSMYEGRRECGRATVVWRAPTDWPVSVEDYARFDRWSSTGVDGHSQES